MQRPVIFDLGHTGRTGGRKGAEHDGLRESEIVRRYVTRACAVLERRGLSVEVLGGGSYGSRQRYARSAGGAAYIACHVNAGWKPGYRGAAFHTTSALGGRVLALELAQAIEDLTGSSRVWATQDSDWTLHAHGLISQTGRVPAAVFEPVFIDNPAHRDLCQAPEQIGDALAAAVLAFLQVR